MGGAQSGEREVLALCLSCICASVTRQYGDEREGGRSRHRVGGVAEGRRWYRRRCAGAWARPRRSSWACADEGHQRDDGESASASGYHEVLDVRREGLFAVLTTVALAPVRCCAWGGVSARYRRDQSCEARSIHSMQTALPKVRCFIVRGEKQTHPCSVEAGSH
jgi:hypothetical protein